MTEGEIANACPGRIATTGRGTVHGFGVHESAGQVLTGALPARLWTYDHPPIGAPLEDMPKAALHVCRHCSGLYWVGEGE